MSGGKKEIYRSQTFSSLVVFAVRPDFITLNRKTGKIIIYECKSSPTAPLTRKQSVGFSEIAEKRGFCCRPGEGGVS